jgi:hypothetical protein
VLAVSCSACRSRALLRAFPAPGGLRSFCFTCCALRVLAPPFWSPQKRQLLALGAVALAESAPGHAGRTGAQQ